MRALFDQFDRLYIHIRRDDYLDDNFQEGDRVDYEWQLFPPCLGLHKLK